MLLLADLTAERHDKTVHSVVHGVVRLEELAPQYGAERRRLRIRKCRGQAFLGGSHDFTIRTGGVEVYPRLVAAEHRSSFERKLRTSGLAELDALPGGGIEQGSSALTSVRPSGRIGQEHLHHAVVAAAMARGERVAIFVFDEELGLLLHRARGLGLDLEEMVETGAVWIEQVDAAELTPGEFAHRVRTQVAQSGAKLVVIDGLNGYSAAMP